MPTNPGEKPTKQLKPTPANAPAEQTPDSELSEIELLRRQVEQQGKLIEQLTAASQAQASAAPGFGGYLVRTPRNDYQGKTAGVQFRDGLAFMAYGPGAKEKAQLLQVEFHYEVREISDWRQAPELASRLVEAIGG